MKKLLNLPKKSFDELMIILRLMVHSVGKDYFKKNFPHLFNYFKDDIHILKTIDDDSD